MQDSRAAVADPRRLDALAETGLLDSEIEEEFDRLTRLASKLLGVPAAFFSLVDEDRDFYKSCFGFDEPLASKREVTGVTFCHYSIVSEGALVIPDTRADPVYRQVPTVESLGVAAYLGVPVHAPGGEVLGSFCTIDYQPKDWSELEIETLKELAKSAEREVAIRHWMRRQRHLMERETAAREELERVMESRTRLMRGFTHDVKNPLGAADGFLALLVDEIVGPLSEKQKESLSRARRAIGRGLALIDELVTIARMEEGRLEIGRAPVSPRDVVREMVEEYRAQAQSKGLELRCKTPDTFPLIRSDETRIRQILGNLLTNAVKYTEAGEIVVRLEIRPDEESGDGSPAVAFDVVDTGIGILAEDLDRLFEEFTRLEPETSHGAGLGLAISQRLAQALGGRITVRSDLGRSSTFSLWLPLDLVEDRRRDHARRQAFAKSR